MHWQGQFRAAFFGAWTDAGLPDPEPHLDRYRSATRAVAGAPPPPPAEPRAPRLPEGGNGPLEVDLIQRVYSFGEVLGEALGRLAGAHPEAARARAGWCGRFNLGISLFDYVCDVAGRGDVLAGVEPFNRFESQDGAAGVPPAGAVGAATSARGDHGSGADPRGATTRAAQPLEVVETYLASLATAVIDDFQAAAAGRLDWQQMLARLYWAERDVASGPLNADADLEAIREVLETVSAEPFALMAAWASLVDADADTDVAVRIGRAVGRCFWLVDDACDLWTDLDAGAWNLFLVRAVALEPRLVTEPRTTLRDIHLSQLLVRSRAADEESRLAVGALMDALADVPEDPGERSDLLGLVAAALAVWS